MRIQSFITQHGPVPDTKAMLLIRYHQPEIVIPDTLGDQCMRSDDQLPLARFNLLQCPPVFCRRHLSGQQSAGDAECRKRRPCIVIVL